MLEPAGPSPAHCPSGTAQEAAMRGGGEGGAEDGAEAGEGRMRIMPCGLGWHRLRRGEVLHEQRYAIGIVDLVYNTACKVVDAGRAQARHIFSHLFAGERIGL